MDTTDIVALDRSAVLETVRIIDLAAPGDWDRPTPCADWTLRQLVEHMAGQHHGFAASAGGGGGDLSVWKELPLGDDPRAGYRAAAERALDAFAGPGITEAPFLLPEIRPQGAFPGRLAIGFHFLDHVVHGWDLAAALGVPLTLPEDVVRAALPLARLVPDDERRRAPGAQFLPAQPSSAQAGPLEHVLTALGRHPDWTPVHRDPTPAGEADRHLPEDTHVR
ncbi:TIGR03086 family metal-binding protein [Streptomyces sp. NPDC056987]|uniref:TIGR03086 family metal-binding protein n=1 Tax=Streptomyces sp. NPDC056987 TaxID=3345988 RepID=UPI00363A4A7A